MKTSFQKIIQREVKRQGLSGYSLAKLVEPHVSMRMIQAYLAGHNDVLGGVLALYIGIDELKDKMQQSKET